MSSGARIGVVVATVVVIVLAFVLLSPGGDDTKTTATAPTTATPPPATTASTTTPTASAPPAAEFMQIRVQAGRPAGGVQTITVKNGERVRIQVASQDTTDEIHLHGYDIKRDLKAGDSVRFSFVASAEGIFEMELEDAGVQIGKLVVEP